MSPVKMYKDTLKKHLLGTTLIFTFSSWGLIKDYAHKRERENKDKEKEPATFLD